MARPRLTVLSSDETEAIDAASVALLSDVGVSVREPRARNLLLAAGASPGEGLDVVRIPEALLREAVAKARKRWTWHARTPQHTFAVGEGGRTRLGPGSTCTKVIDFDTGECRAPRQEDSDAFVRLLDALELADINYSPVLLQEDGVDPHYLEVATFVRDLGLTSKVPVGPTFDGVVARRGLKVASILVGGEEELRKRPTVAGYCDPVGPLIHDRAMTEALIEYARLGQPVFLMVLDLAGASAPATLAGVLVQQNAEILSGLLIGTLVNRDAPMSYGCASGAMDMRVGNAALGGPEAGLLAIAAVQIAHFYGLPCSTAGQCDAKIPDAQAALEKATTLYASVLAGSDFVDLFFGSFEGYNATSLEQTVIDHDIAGMVFRYARGIEVNEDTLALDQFPEVGAGGSWLRGKRALRHVQRSWQAEFHTPFLADRRSRRAWELAGRRSMFEEAHRLVEAILAEHRAEPLDPALRREMDAYLARLRSEDAKGRG